MTVYEFIVPPMRALRQAAERVRHSSYKSWLCGSLALWAASANASPCDRLSQALTSAERANLSTVVAGQLETASVKILGAYRLGNWYLVHVDTVAADEDFIFFRGDPPNHQYVALWGRAGAKTDSTELRNWARLNAPGVPETLARCFTWAAGNSRPH